MSRDIDQRLTTLRSQIPAGCPACRDWPHVWIITEGDPEPPAHCDRCGRLFSGLIRVYVVGVSLADI